MDTLSTFSGFPQAGLEFFANLAAHNNLVWFEAQKEEYQVVLLEPAQAFVMTLGAKLQALSGGIRCDPRTDGKGVLMRLHRDARFSPDKIPYHTHISGLFWEGARKRQSVQLLVFKSRRLVDKNGSDRVKTGELVCQSLYAHT